MRERVNLMVNGRAKVVRGRERGREGDGEREKERGREGRE